MDTPLARLDREKLNEAVRVELERVLVEVADAVDDAPKGRLIRDSEHQVRDAMDGFRTFVYETALQMKVDGGESAFPPSHERNDEQKETP
jgi:hypothetical protein